MMVTKHLGLACWAIVAAVLFWGCQDEGASGITSDMIHFDSQADNKNGPRPEASFQDTVWAIGVVAEGTVKRHTFKLKNTGDAPLLLADVSASCGCTVAHEWPKGPIAPGEEVGIGLVYDSRGRAGEITSTVMVVTNAYPSTTTLTLAGRVLGPEDNQVILNK